MTGKREVLVFANYEKMVDFAVKQWTDIASAAIQHKDYFAVALSGGKTPVRFYQKLGRHKDILWHKIHIFLADERFVPFDDKQSNYRMIKENLLDSVIIPVENIHPVDTQEVTPETAATSYEHHMRNFFMLKEGEIPAFDLILLGIGEDGHTASLFPGTLSLKEKERLVVAVNTESVTHDRISLSLPVINRAQNIIFLVSGKKKARIVKKILEEESKGLPAAQMRLEKGTIFFLLDKDAGRYLSD